MPATTYFFEERFEGGGYHNTWDETGATGTVDEDYTVSPLEALQSLRLAATAQHPMTKSALSSDQGELWMFFRLRVNTTLATGRRIVGFLDASNAEAGGVNLTTGNALQAKAGAQLGTATTDTLTNGTDYNVWVHIKKSTGGSNGSCSVGFSASTTEVTSGTSFSNKTTGGDSAVDMHSVQVQITNPAGSNTASGEIVVDKILISNTATIGNSPP